jgi:hypothetical protein
VWYRTAGSKPNDVEHFCSGNARNELHQTRSRVACEPYDLRKALFNTQHTHVGGKGFPPAPGAKCQPAHVVYRQDPAPPFSYSGSVCSATQSADAALPGALMTLSVHIRGSYRQPYSYAKAGSINLLVRSHGSMALSWVRIDMVSWAGFRDASHTVARSLCYQHHSDRSASKTFALGFPMRHGATSG